MKTIGIKLADGSFYPVLEENTNQEKTLDLTTANNNQTRVMVDLYRSAMCSMDDAEYVDTLQIDNLIEHPNGEPDISFSVSIDENNELSAKIIDKETGSQSKTTITLVSRTAEERMVTDDYSISDSINEEKDHTATKVAAAAIAGGGLLAAAAAYNNRQTEENSEVIADETIVDEPLIEEQVSDDLPDFPEEETPSFDETITEEATVEEPATEETIFEEPVAEETIVEEPAAEETIFEETAAEETIEEPVTEVFDDAVNTEEQITEDSTLSTDLPDFDSISFGDSETETNDFDTENSDSNPLADFDIDEPEDSAESDNIFEDNTEIEESSVGESLTDFDIPDDFSDTTEASSSLDDLDLPDFNEAQNSMVTDRNDSDDNWTFNNLREDNTSDDIPAGSGISFTGLYDKETELGESSSYEEEEVRKRTKTPVIICIICAIICILTTLFILFVIPGTLKNNKKTKENVTEVTVAEAVVETVKEPEVIPEPVPEAKEDEVIIIEKAEEVVPEQPPVVEEPKAKPKNTTYKIKWGDTLWDIANTYYKNPWRYKYIARYNKIKDPDYIISGTIITIPAE